MKQIATHSAVSPDEVRAAAEVRRELGPDYDNAVVESFLERLGPEIDARVDARVAQVVPARAAESHPPSVRLAVVSIALGIPLTAIIVGNDSQLAGLIGVLVIWLAIAVINVAYAISSRSAKRRR